MTELPRIDLTSATRGSEAERRAAFEIDRACKEVGFFTLSGHGIPPAVFEEAYATSRDFFRLPFEVKNQCRLRSGFTMAADDYTPYGYSGMLEENAFAYTGRKGLPSDYVEKFSTGRLVCDDGMALPFNGDPEGRRFRTALKTYFQACESFTERLAELFSIALDLPRDFFVRRTSVSNDSLRSLLYPRLSRELANDQGMGEHTDGTLLTILAQTGPGIQVKDRSGTWITPRLGGRDQLIVNIGDLMARWSNDEYVSTPHRVVLSGEERQSIVFFKLANDDALIECFPKFCENTPAKYEPVIYKNFSLQKMNALFGQDGTVPKQG
ncbi:isopenicillin N synthase family dioxygenase [Cystobacter fuscus]|uniref:isopenicillin N synthase family dioxygenase n=1 Tax=Cystobacter fuscus TaxID=43 RepID=UPI002B291BAB|nr:isopenicillin N synthase family oxygenase [Cystobacter fuscus]